MRVDLVAIFHSGFVNGFILGVIASAVAVLLICALVALSRYATAPAARPAP